MPEYQQPPVTPTFLDLSLALFEELAAAKAIDASVPPTLSAVYNAYSDDTRAFINNFVWPISCLAAAVQEFAMADRFRALDDREHADFCELRAGMLYAQAAVAIDVPRFLQVLQQRPNAANNIMLQFLQTMSMGKTPGGAA